MSTIIPDKNTVSFCPYCGYPPLMKRYVGRGNHKLCRIYCPITSCDMPFEAQAISEVKAIQAWNKIVEREKERMKT